MLPKAPDLGLLLGRTDYSDDAAWRARSTRPAMPATVRTQDDRNAPFPRAFARFNRTTGWSNRLSSAMAVATDSSAFDLMNSSMKSL
jgi:hypothetical protein